MYLLKSHWQIQWRKENKLVQDGKEAGVKVQVGHVERFNPAFLAVKDIELKPMFIEVHRLGAI